MSALIEDSLKSTRTLHRLIITVSLVTLVFAFSLDRPEEKVAQKDAIEALLKSDFRAYETFVAEKVEDFRQRSLAPLGQQLTARLEASGHLVFNLDDLGDAFGEPIHVGRILTHELAFANMEATNLTALKALNAFSLSQDIQVLVPEMPGVAEEIVDFLDSHQTTGKRIAGIRMSIEDFSFGSETFLPGATTTAGLYFELVDAVRIGGAPVFSADFPVAIQTLPDTSFIHWLSGNERLLKTVSLKEGQITFLPELENLPTGFTEEKLALLFKRLSDEIAESGPEEQSATILGTKVPGLLVVIASPLTLLVLGYYFANHTKHLTRFSLSDPEAFRGFAWMPLAMQDEPKSATVGSLEVSKPAWWAVETVASAIALPIGALLALYWQLSQFGGVGTWSALTIFSGIVGVVCFGLMSLSHIGAIRRAHAEDQP